MYENKRYTNRIKSALVSVLIIFSLFNPILIASAVTANETISIGSATVAPGDTVVLPITLANTENIAGVSLDISYDPNIVNITNIVANNTVAGSSVSPNINNTIGIATIVLTNVGSPTVTTATPIIDITFEAVGTSGSLALSLLTVELTDDSFNIYEPAFINNGTITILTDNVAPVAADQSATTDENTPVDIALSATDSDGDTLTYSIVDQPANGSVTLNANVATYTPATDYNGADSFTFKANDSALDSNIATVSVIINAVNDAPVAADQSATTDENIPVDITLSATDSDGDTLTYSIVDDPAHGSVTLNANVATYTPVADYNGADSFTFKANDGILDSNIATVSVTIDADNAAPVAADQSATTDENTPVDIALSATDSDGDTLTYSIVLDISYDPNIVNITNIVANNTVADSSVSPNINNNIGMATIVLTNIGSPTVTTATSIIDITFEAVGGSGSSALSLLNVELTDDSFNIYEPAFINNGTITILTDGAAPVAVDQSATTDEDIPVDITLLATDSDGDPLTYSIVDEPTNGSVTLNTNVATYTPATDYNGVDTFTFKANDGVLDSNIATVAVTIDAVNDAPVAADTNAIATENTPVDITLSVTDPDGDTLIYSIIDQPTNGSVTLNANVATYTPATDYNGADSFTFKANDSALDSNVATVSLSVNEVNDAPIAVDHNATTAEDIPVDITLSATDPEGNSLTYSIVVNPAHGSVTLNANVTTYTPATDYNGTDSFTFKANDGVLDSNIATVSLTIDAVNDAPVAADTNAIATENTPVNITLLATDPDGDALTYSIVVNPVHGNVTLNANIATYEPATDYNGTDSFTFRANDSVLDSNIGNISITINLPPVNDDSNNRRSGGGRGSPIGGKLDIISSTKQTDTSVDSSDEKTDADPVSKSGDDGDKKSAASSETSDRTATSGTTDTSETTFRTDEPDAEGLMSKLPGFGLITLVIGLLGVVYLYLRKMG